MSSPHVKYVVANADKACNNIVCFVYVITVSVPNKITWHLMKKYGNIAYKNKKRQRGTFGKVQSIHVINDNSE